MKISLGTTSIDKKTIVQDCFTNLNFDSEILPCCVDSMITDQPLDEETTTIGAMNRAKNALNTIQESDLGLGLEGGLSEINGLYYLVCVVAIVDRNNHYCLGVSSKLALPKKVSEEIKAGGQFGDSIRNFESENKGNTELEAVIEKLTTRKDAFKEAINNAILQYKNLKFY